MPHTTAITAMKPRAISSLVLGRAGLAALLIAAPGCGQEEAASRDRFRVEVASLELAGITNARYTITVSAQGQTVWTRSIDADRYGDGTGGVSYVGPCDASPEAQPNTVTVVLDALEVDGVDVPSDTWQNPTPVSQSLDCRENADVAVSFDLVVMRDAVQGFFDVAVSFEDIFCSAKFDCVPELLHNGPDRALTGVMAFACAGGPGTDTTLYMTDVVIDCPGVPPVVLSPARSLGQHEIDSDLVFGIGTYYGKESLAGLDKCYWNTAIGLSLVAGEAGSNPANCRVRAKGTAAQGNLGVFPGGWTPEDTRYPIIEWNVLLTDAAGQLLCESHPLNGPDGGVTTRYSELTGEPFRWPCECGDKPRQTCAGATPTVAGADLMVDATPDGTMTVTLAGLTTTLQLPAGVTLDEQVGCCIDPCCSVAP